MTTTPTAQAELSAAADRLEAQMQAATPMPWRVGSAPDAIVGPAGPGMTESETSYYGGPLVAESLEAADQDLILAFGRLGGPLVAMLRSFAKEFGPGEVLDDVAEPVVRALLDAILAPSEVSA